MPSFMHFSTRSDYERLAHSHELLSNLYFVPDTQFDSEAVPFIRGLLSLPDLGRINHPVDHAGPIYWVFPEEPKLGVRSLGEIDERMRYALATADFDVALQFTPNGMWGEKTLICGTLETTRDIGVTVALHRAITNCFAKEYVKSKYFNSVTYVGPDALALRKKRYRLCANPNLGSADNFKPNRSG